MNRGDVGWRHAAADVGLVVTEGRYRISGMRQGGARDFTVMVNRYQLEYLLYDFHSLLNEDSSFMEKQGKQKVQSY